MAKQTITDNIHTVNLFEILIYAMTNYILKAI